jgi:hypothetical protein
MSHELPADWRGRIEAILADQIGALGPIIFNDVLESTGFSDREPSLREALHVFEVLKKELPSHLQEGEVPSEILQYLFGKHGEIQ